MVFTFVHVEWTDHVLKKITDDIGNKVSLPNIANLKQIGTKHEFLSKRYLSDALGSLTPFSKEGGGEKNKKPSCGTNGQLNKKPPKNIKS